MYDRFTDRARRAMTLARREAVRLGHDHVGTEHVLLGLVKEGRGIAVSVLRALAIDVATVRAEVEQRVSGGGSPPGTSHMPFTPGTRKVLELALEEAVGLGQTSMGTGHLLLGLVRESAGVAARVLRAVGAHPAHVRREVASRGAGTPAHASREAVAARDKATSVIDLDREIAAAALEKEAAVLAHDFERAVVLRDRAKALRERRARIVGSWPLAALVRAFHEAPDGMTRVFAALGVREEDVVAALHRGIERDPTGGAPARFAPPPLEALRDAAPGLEEFFQGVGVRVRAFVEALRAEIGFAGTEAVDAPPQEDHGMFDRFTDRARKVMGLARQQAQRLNNDYIGTEHILLGLVEEGSGVGAAVLKNLDVDLTKVRAAVERLVEPGTVLSPTGQLPFTPRAKKVLELSLEEASNLGHTYIGSEHLLLGLIREGQGIAAQVLRTLDVKVEDAREEVLELLGADPQEPGESGSEGRETAPPETVSVLRVHDALRDLRAARHGASRAARTLHGDALRAVQERVLRLLAASRALAAGLDMFRADATKTLHEIEARLAAEGGSPAPAPAWGALMELLSADPGALARVLEALGVSEAVFRTTLEWAARGPGEAPPAPDKG